jgi:guanylate kinase
LNKQFDRHGILFVISAPSGAGKTTLVEALRQSPDFVYSVSCTTRTPRAGEIEGEDYQFSSAAEFHARAEAGDFLEYAQVHGDYYGTLRKPLLSNLKNGVQPPFATATIHSLVRRWPMFLLCRPISTNSAAVS